MATSEVLKTCYENLENIKQFTKKILTTPVYISYNNVELKVLTIERYTEPIEYTQPAFTYTKLTIETLEQGVKYVQS